MPAPQGGIFMDPDLLKQLSDMLSEKDIDLNQILENFQSTSSNENTTNSQNDSNQFDPEILLKMQKLLSLLNKNKDSKDEVLLKALKPYMRDSRKEKIDQYIKLLHILNLFEKFQEMGGNLSDFL